MRLLQNSASVRRLAGNAFILLSLGWGLIFPTAAHATDTDLLDPDQAFQVTARFADAKTLALEYRIEPGYYLYRNRFHFSLEAGPAVLAKARIPAGKMKQDPTFGRVPIHVNSVRILIPVAWSHKGGLPPGQQLVLKTVSQGCAAAGVCFPPQHHELTLSAGSTDIVFPSATRSGAFSKPNAAGSILDSLKKSP